MKPVLLLLIICLGFTTVSPTSCDGDTLQGRWKIQGVMDYHSFTEHWEFGKKGRWCELKREADDAEALTCRVKGRWQQSGDKLSITYEDEGYYDHEMELQLHFTIEPHNDTIYLHLVNHEDFYGVNYLYRTIVLTNIDK